ncbi:DUF6882 domain-containing protein [Corynebacterium hindlerae]|uniref:DUF6882 domain-containing protein n=1 Tax=Corynebacterium hindlerae TaxID=699041 RepID=UPI0031B71FCC
MIPEIWRIGQHCALLSMVKQDMLGELLEGSLGPNYQAAYDRGVLTFASDRGRVYCDTSPVASIAVDPATLLWRWSPMIEGEEEYFRPEASHGYRAFGEQCNFSSFTTQEVPYEVVDDVANTIANLGNDVINTGFVIFGPEANFYQAAFNNAGSRVVWKLDNIRDDAGPLTVPSPDLNTLLTKIPRYLPLVDDPAWSLEGVASHFKGVECAIARFPSDRRIVATYTLSDGAQHEVQVTQDEQGRITNIQLAFNNHLDSMSNEQRGE